MTIGSTTKVVDFGFVVMPTLCVEVLVGNELSTLLKLEVHNRKVCFGEGGKGARVRYDSVVPPRSQMMIETVVSPALSEGDEVATTPYNMGHSFIVANVVAKANSDRSIACAVANLEQSALHLLAGTQIAGLSKLEYGKLEGSKVTAAIVPLDEKSDESVNLGDELTESQRQDVLMLLRRRKLALSIHGAIGETNVVQHEIELEPGTRPVCEPLRRRPLAHRQEAERQVQKLLEEGVIEPSSSPWSSA